MTNLRAPFPYFGGKARVAADVWRRFGEVNVYIEPFCGSAAVFLAAPYKAQRETLNDADGLLVNVWRTCRYEPEAIDDVRTWPRSEVEKRARRDRIDREEPELVERLKADETYFDAGLAASWVFIRSAAILGDWSHGSVSRPTVASQGVFTKTHPPVQMLRSRLSRVRLLVGDWSRCVTQNEIWKESRRTAVFLDPPYLETTGRQMGLYNATDSGTVANDVRSWAIEAGEDRRLRIALCGYEGEHQMPDSWECLAWKSKGAFEGKVEGRKNYEAERIWFSPGCERPERQLDMFGAS